MSTKWINTLKGLVLVGLSLFLANAIINGTLLFYINRRFTWLTGLSIILLLLMASTYRRTGHDHDHRHHHARENAWTALALVALPLLLGLLVPPRPLGAQAVGVRKANTDGVGLSADETALARASVERNILDWLRAFNAAGDPSAFTGQEARVIGFVYRDETFAADQFMVSRFVVSCCVADAAALGLVVAWPDSANLPLDAWVAVQGTFRPGQFGGEPTPILSADHVTPTQPPNQLYLYP